VLVSIQRPVTLTDPAIAGWFSVDGGSILIVDSSVRSWANKKMTRHRATDRGCSRRAWSAATSQCDAAMLAD
jgi:hypothetical protein